MCDPQQSDNFRQNFDYNDFEEEDIDPDDYPIGETLYW